MNNSDAAFTLFISMCFVDGDWQNTEGDQALSSLAQLGLAPTENGSEIMKKLMAGDQTLLFDAGQQVSGWSTKEKLAMVTEMSKVAHADNDFDEKEMRFIVLFGSMWGIEKDDLLNATFSR
jgi:uncharacterized tellurite resistance protein B-like protein